LPESGVPQQGTVVPRLFTGLEIPPPVGLALSLKRGALDGARWIEPEDYHLTLRFIGDVDNLVAGEVVEGLERLADSEAFEVRLTHLGVFGGDKPRALYAGAEANPLLLRLQAAQERVLQRMGLEPEGRKYTPHVTLARLRGTTAADAAGYIAASARFEPLVFPAARFVLFSARSAVGGGPYVVEQVYPLASLAAAP
jgi:2'-5' RNA ligase